MKRMPSDMHVTYFNAVTSRDESFVSTSVFSSFAMDNLSLLTAIAARREQHAAGNR